MNKINRMISKQSTHPVNPGNPVQKPPASQLCSPPNDGAEPPPPVTQREQAKWTTSNPTLWPKPKAGGGWLQRSGSAIQGSSTQKSPIRLSEKTRWRRPWSPRSKRSRQAHKTHGKKSVPSARKVAGSKSNRRQRRKQRVNSLSVLSVASCSKAPASLAH